MEPRRRRGRRQRHRLERGRRLRGHLGPVDADGRQRGDWDKSRWINLTGASGHAFSANYTDQTGKWVDGELLDWSFGTNAVGQSTVDTLTLRSRRAGRQAVVKRRAPAGVTTASTGWSCGSSGTRATTSLS
ncbi:penicillin acylase family protein [Streptomyces sp. M10(2022)]